MALPTVRCVWQLLVKTRAVLKTAHCKSATKWFRAEVIRFYVHDFLNQDGIKTQLVDDSDNPENADVIFEPRVLAGNGIAGNVNGYEYRILKICKGGLPPPVTEKRQIYYNNEARFEGCQPPLIGLASKVSYTHMIKPNLIYLWELVKMKVNLYLAVPKHPLLYAETKLTLIPNPILGMKQAQVEETETKPIGAEQKK